MTDEQMTTTNVWGRIERAVNASWKDRQAKRQAGADKVAAAAARQAIAMERAADLTAKLAMELERAREALAELEAVEAEYLALVNPATPETTGE